MVKAKRKSVDLVNLHAEAMEEFSTIQSAVRYERLQMLKDRRFASIAGAQWEDRYGDQFENKPKLEVNKVQSSLIRIYNEYRNNNISVYFTGRDGTQDQDKLAELCNDMLRADEKDCDAQEAYDSAFDEAASGGIGGWRVRTVYEEDAEIEEDKQRIIFEPIFDADSCIFFSLDSKRQDKQDADKCFVLTGMSHAKFRQVWGEDPASVPKEIHQDEFDWVRADVVYVAEYYKVDRINRKYVIYEHIGDGRKEAFAEDELDQDRKELLAAIGAVPKTEKTIEEKKVRKYYLSGNKVLEDCGYIAGDSIPIAPLFGKRWFVDNIERAMGHVRLAKDIQVVKNTQISRLMEIASFSPVEVPIVTPDQIASHAEEWTEGNIKNAPYRLLNPVTNQDGTESIPPLQYIKPPQIPPALAALMQITEEDINDLLGNQQEGDKVVSNIGQGTVELIQTRLDKQTYIYMYNMAKAKALSAKIWLGMAKDVYFEEGRSMKAIDESGNARYEKIYTPSINSEKNFENDISSAKLDVNIEVGASSSSKKSATVSKLLQMGSLNLDEADRSVINALIMMNLEGEGVNDVHEYYRKKLVSAGVIPPNEQERKLMEQAKQEQKPSPQDQYLLAEANKAQTEAVKNQVEVFNEQAKTDKTRAETQKILQDINVDQLKAVSELIEKLGPRVDDNIIAV